MTVSHLLLALRLVLLHGPDEQIVQINPESVVALRDPRGRSGEHFHASVHCLIFTNDAKYTPVQESCAVVKQKLEEAK